jgi:hypothetical protein
MEDEIFKVSSTVKIFPVKNPWVYVDIPEEYTEMLKRYADRGLVAVRVTLGKNTWNTSLMPMGNGTQFIPLSAKVRKAENIEVGDRVNLTFILRKR